MRPLGVSLIGGLEIFVSGLLLLIAIATAMGMGWLDAILGSTARMGGPELAILAGAGIVAALALLIPSALFGLLGWKLLQMREWARIVTLVLSVLGGLGAGIGFISALAYFRPFFVVATLARLSINLAILWYLTRSRIRELFQGNRQVLIG
jgi:hypothetical protein